MSSYQHANQSNCYSRNILPHPTTSLGMYSSNINRFNVGHGGVAPPPSHATVYAATAPSSAPSSNYNSAIQPGGGGAPNIMQQHQQGTALSYNAYGGGASELNKANAASYTGDIFYSCTAMPGHPTTAIFQVGPSSSSPTQMLSHQHQQQQQLNANAAAMAAHRNPATNINIGYKLFVGQVPAVCTEKQLQPLFAQFGRLLEIKVMREPNGRSRGSAWVRYESEISAQRAIEALNEKHIVPPQTNALRVQFAAPPQSWTPAPPMQLHPSPTGAMSAFIAQSPQPSHYPTATYVSAPQGYAPAANTTTTTYFPQEPYTSSNVVSYGSGGDTFAMLASPQNPPQLSPQSSPPQQQQQLSRRVEYVRGCPSGGGMLYATPVSTAAAGAMQQQQLIYAAGEQTRTGVVYAPEGFTMTSAKTSTQQQRN